MSRIRRLSALAVALAVTVAGAPTLARSLTSAGDEQAAAPATDRQAERVAPELAGQLAAAPATGPAPPLAVFVHAATIGEATAASERAGLRVIDTFDRVGVAYAIGPPGAVQAVTEMPAVTYVEDDRPIELFMETSHQATRGAEARTAFKHIPRNPEPVHAWDLEMSRDSGPAFAGEIDGRGVTVAVIDGGVDGAHPMFVRDGVSKVRRNMKLVCMNHPPGISFGSGVPQNSCPDEPQPFWLDMTSRGNDTDTMSLGGHGTHVAGIVAGYDVTMPNGDRLHGAAPGADLVSLSMGYSIAIYGGASSMNWVLEHHRNPCTGCHPIKVINNSWGSSGSYNPNSVLAKIQDELVREGITVVWAAGNSGGDGSGTTLNPESQSPTPGILAVANYDDADTGVRDGSLAASSSRGTKGNVATYPDVSAPGMSITSACRAQLTICTDGDNYGTISGTSMASPHVAGIVAQLHQVKPAIKPWQVEDVLEDSAHRFGFGAPYEPDDPARNDGLTSFDKGHGLVDATTAIARLLGVTDPTVTADCVAGAPVLIDPTGDAQWLVVSTSRPSEPTLDVVSARVAEQGHLVFTINIADLAASAPAGANGIAFDWDFKRGNETWNLRSHRTPTAESHRLVVTDALGTATTISGLSGAFDVEADQVRASVPISALQEAGVAPPKSGQFLSEFAITSWRQEGVLLAGVDIASSGCAYIFGSGTAAIPASFVARPPPPDPGDADARLHDEETFEDEGTPPGSTFQYHCSGPNDPKCITYLLDLAPSGGRGELEVTLASDVFGTVAEDFDVYVYDLEGNELGVAGNPQTVGEHVVVPIPASGLYYLVVQPYTATPDSPYTVAATLH